MKKLVPFLAMGMLLLAATTGHADLSYSTSYTFPGTNGFQLNFGNQPDGFSSPYQLTTTFDPALGSFSSASLAITYSQVDTTSEVWAAWVSNTGGSPAPGSTLTYVSLGQLTGYNDTYKHTQTFDLLHLPAIPEGGLAQWDLYVAFRETTAGVDKMRLFSIESSGTYQAVEQYAVPVPPTFLLLASGLVGLGSIFRWRKRQMPRPMV